jgi:DNA-binding LacI/PurR family transcriptional regulator
MGKQATQLLLSEIQAEKRDEAIEPQHIILHTELIIRNSSATHETV